MNSQNNTTQILCKICEKNIHKSRKTTICYKDNLENTIDICHWTCFKNTISNTHDHTYIGIKMYRKGIPCIVKWIDLSDKDKKNAKTLLTKIKMYGDLKIHKIHISGMCADSMMLTSDDVSKIYKDNSNTTKKLFFERKKEWLQTEKNLNIENI